ncbi:MAG: prolyl oligopeptidase family serine peptidase [Eubacteriales bacterium]
MAKKISEITAYTFVGDFGQTVERFELKLAGTADKVEASDFRIIGGRKDISGKVLSEGITSVEANGKTLVLNLDPFVYFDDFAIEGENNASDYGFKKADVTNVVTKIADDFEYCNENGVNYRLYKPEVNGPRPLVLFLHGGGECGTDNNMQMTGTMGAANLAERWPDMYIMAPQAPDNGISLEEMLSKYFKNGIMGKVVIGGPTQTTKGSRGWNREYVANVCGIIRKMIADGLVDGRRVYVTGMSMGGAGVIHTLSADANLFAAAAPMCPSMNGETYAMLCKLPNVPTWISAAYIDHQPGRHAYLHRAIEQLRLTEGRDVRLTLFTPEELEEYGIGCHPELTEKQIYSENHNCWTLTLHNEHCILDWLISNEKN